MSRSADDGRDTEVDRMVTSVEETRGLTARRIQRSPGLPGGRAVIGALLVTAAAVTVFAAHLGATAEPTTVYLVADGIVEPGTRFVDRVAVLEAFTSEAITLSPPLAARAVPVEDLDALIGSVVVAPLAYGDLLLRSGIAPEAGVDPSQSLSFRISAPDAVAGSLVAGERLDVLATFGSGERAYTNFVVRDVPLLRIGALDGGTVGPASDLSLTVAVAALEDVQALAHAIATGSLLVTRSTAGAQQLATPGVHRAGPDEVGAGLDRTADTQEAGTP